MKGKTIALVLCLLGAVGVLVISSTGATGLLAALPILLMLSCCLVPFAVGLVRRTSNGESEQPECKHSCCH
jgi:hypothetical protein